ncbi:putative farnesyl pyrophosphate synthetase [Babesia divergens]|uniref:Farnesyl pyrophosphate synthetase n=1 Tax=Babesia divergens TaxID=32595 RepID=A0AAD9LHT6_BABDI|nr:putative farnesyl pyrophosphate synthetase [Babesia divergens]
MKTPSKIPFSRGDIISCKERFTQFLPSFMDIALSELKGYDVSDDDMAYYSHAIQYNLQGTYFRGTNLILTMLYTLINPALAIFTISTGGKLIRGTLVVSTARSIMGEGMTDFLWHQALVLGWCLELLQTAFLVADDIMDKSVMRRSNVCWYMVPTIGVANAVNDTMFLYTLTHRILSNQIKDSPHLVALQNLFNQASMVTILGQHMDTYDAMDTALLDSATAATSLYYRICKNKTSYYTFYLPIKLGMIICDINQDNINFKKLESITSLLGHLFQAQDDYLDCYGDPSCSGKEGTDIQTRKCTWLLATALHICNKDQLQRIKNNIGKDDIVNVTAVKEIYNELKLQNIFKTYSQDIRIKIQSEIDEIESRGGWYKKHHMHQAELAFILQWSLDTITNRNR